MTPGHIRRFPLSAGHAILFLSLFCHLANAPRSHAAAGLDFAFGIRARSALCDYLIITDSSFTDQAERLATLRHELTPEVAAQPCIAQMADIYRDFPPRGPKWTSVQDFLKAAFAESGPDLPHVVLLGDASHDEDSLDNHVPTFTLRIQAIDGRWRPDTTFYDTLTTDDAYPSFFDTLSHSGITPMAFAIGRIPARTAEEADVYLDKVEAYEGSFAYGPQAFTYGFLNDDDMQRGAMNDQETIGDMPELHQKVWDALEVKPFVRRVNSLDFPIDSDGTKPAATDATLALFNAGPGRVYFTGHGSHTQLTNERLFKVPDDLTRLRAKPLQPIVSMLACTTAEFALPGEPSLGEQLLFHPHGAVAFIGGTIPTFPYPNNSLFIQWNANALEGGTLGRTFARAKDAGFDPLNNAAYVLLGDPALTLPVPEFDLVPASGSSVGRLVLDDAGSTGDSVYFQLVRIDSLPFNALIQPYNSRQKDRFYPSESVVTEGWAVLGAGGIASFYLPSTGSPGKAAVKVMTWNDRGMRYGHFPLESLGQELGGQTRLRAPERKKYRLVVRGGDLVMEGQGRRVGLDGRVVR